MIKLSKNNLQLLISWGVIISENKNWTKHDSKLMLKMSAMIKELNHQTYKERKRKSYVV
jgi:hypothetical protein